MKGKLIIIEAGDGSGKETQTKRLYMRLESSYKVRKVEYPNYQSDSSALIKMYLNGDFGSRPDDVNPYVASTFYAVDRYASFKTDWEEFYINGGIVLADRYTTSNMVHQASKIYDEVDKDKYLDWLCNYEFCIFGLPVPDCVIFLDMPPEFSLELIRQRESKISGEKRKDIHEDDSEYLKESYLNSLKIAEKYGWIRIPCTTGDKIRSIDEIHEDIYDAVKNIL